MNIFAALVFGLAITLTAGSGSQPGDASNGADEASASSSTVIPSDTPLSDAPITPQPTFRLVTGSVDNAIEESYDEPTNTGAVNDNDATIPAVTTTAAAAAASGVSTPQPTVRLVTSGATTEVPVLTRTPTTDVTTGPPMTSAPPVLEPTFHAVTGNNTAIPATTQALVAPSLSSNNSVPVSTSTMPSTTTRSTPQPAVHDSSLPSGNFTSSTSPSGSTTVNGDQSSNSNGGFQGAMRNKTIHHSVSSLDGSSTSGDTSSSTGMVGFGSPSGENADYIGSGKGSQAAASAGTTMLLWSTKAVLSIFFATFVVF